MTHSPQANTVDTVRNEQASDAFSRYAPQYDNEHERNPVARWTRRRNLVLLSNSFARGTTVLEIGCGTGTEAIHLARRGVHVIGTDAAPGMISVLRAKLAPGGEASDVAGRVQPFVLAASELSKLGPTLTVRGLDGAYSSFGPLNCEADLAGVLDNLAELVRPGGRVVVSLLTRYCLWETVWYLLHGDMPKAFRRWGGSASATVRGSWQETRVPVYYWSTRAVRDMAAPYFKIEHQMALPWLAPPQYLGGLVRRAPGLFKLLSQIDRKLASRWPFYALGDHYVLSLIRRDD